MIATNNCIYSLVSYDILDRLIRSTYIREILVSRYRKLVTMKLVELILISVFIIETLSRKFTPDVKTAWEGVLGPHSEECIAKTNPDPMKIMTMFDTATLPDERSFHCFMKCIYDKLSFLTPSGELDEMQMVDVVHLLSHELAKICFKMVETETDLCKKAYVVTKCIVDDVAIDD